MVWTHGAPALQQFLNTLNEHNSTIKFTANWSSEEVTFLDTRVYIKGLNIETDLYVKPTDTHQYLHIESCHPQHCKYSILYSQALRLHRICSAQENLLKRCEELKEHLSRRGYPDTKELLKSEIQWAISTPREDSLQLRHREKSDCVPLTVTYHPNLPSLRHATRRTHSILQPSEYDSCQSYVSSVSTSTSCLCVTK